VTGREVRAAPAPAPSRSFALCRGINERILETSGSDPLDLVCECARPGCFVNVLVTAAEFTAIAAEGGVAVVAPGHGERGGTLVRREAGYDVVLVPGRPATPWDELLQRICHSREEPLCHPPVE
jgi:hypothetical protein